MTTQDLEKEVREILDVRMCDECVETLHEAHVEEATAKICSLLKTELKEMTKDTDLTLVYLKGVEDGKDMVTQECIKYKGLLEEIELRTRAIGDMADKAVNELAQSALKEN